MSPGNIVRHVRICLLLYSGFAAAQTATTTSLTSSPNPANLGQAVTLTATVSSGATGKVTFYDGTTILGISPISGAQAIWSTVLLPPGARSLRAHYQGDGSHSPSSSAVVAEAVHALPSSALGTPTSYVVSVFPASPTVGDFNRDGKPDLALTNSALSNTASSSIKVLLGAGDGEFQPAVSYSINGSVNGLAGADFNGDGKEDLVVAAGGSPMLLLGNGDGTFQNPIPLSVGLQAASPVAADFNGDGKADLVLGGDGNVLVLIGNGDGTFQPPASLTVPGDDYNVSVLVGDFNGDSIPDLCLTSGTTVSVWLGNGDGTFLSAVTYPSSLNIMPVFSADLNGDGKMDLVAVSANSSGINILLGNGDGTFQPPVVYGNNIGAVYSAVVGDINGDGKLDLTIPTSSAIVVLYGNGDGTFQSATTLISLDDVGPQVIADFNGDGITDVAVLSAESGLVNVYLGGAVPDLAVAVDHGNGLTHGQTGAEYHITVSNVGSLASSGAVNVTDSMPSGITATAIGGNGWGCTLASLSCTRSDSLAAGASYPQIAVMVNLANSLTGSVTNTATVSGGGDANASNNTASDVTTPRIPTTISLSPTPATSILGQPLTLTATVAPGGTGKVTFYDGTAVLGIAALASGQAVFTSSLLLPGTHSLTARYDGDTNYGPSLSSISVETVSALTATGYHSALSFQVLPPTSVAVADFNRDGKPDVVTAGNGGISVFLGNGDGSLQSAVTYSVAPATSAQTMRVGDFNGDGIADVIVSAALANGNYGLFVFLGNGDGTFQPAIPSPSTDLNYNLFVIGDFDGDGRLDVATVSGLGAGVAILLGNGDGSLRAPLTTTLNLGGQSIEGLAVCDLNLDGKPDLIVNTFFDYASEVILLGNGDGTFSSGATYTRNALGYKEIIAVADVNGDGRPDLVELSAVGTNVYLGNGDGTLATAAINSALGYSSGSNLVIGDFNGDGKLDFAFQANTSGTTSVVEIALGNGDGSFSTRIDLPVNGSINSTDPTVALADLNGDGVPDLVAVGSNVLVYLGGQFSGLQVSSSHNGVLVPGQTLTYTITVTNPTFVLTSGVITVKDTLPAEATATAIGGSQWSCTLASLTCTTSVIGPLQSDNPITLTVMASANLMPSTLFNVVSVTYANVTNTASDPTEAGLPTTTSLTVSPNPVTLAGAVTLTAGVSSGVGTITFQVDAIQLGTVTLSGNQASLTTRLIPAGLHKIIATYSGDSTHAPSTSTPVALSVNSAAATSLAAVATLATGAGPTDVLVSDLNGDGKMDFLTVNAIANTVSVFMGNGDGTFQARADYTVGMQPAAAVIADFNGDGKPDIAVANQSGGTISVLLNNGNGTFVAGAVIIIASPNNIVAADFDGDGKVDLAVIGAGNVSFFFGLGDGTFRQGTGGFYSCCLSPLAVGDFNGDGRPDLAAGTYVYLNNGAGTFGGGVGLEQASAWAVGDLNRDGKSDLAGPYGGLETILGNGDGTFKPPFSYIAGLYPDSLALADTNGDGKLDAVVSNSGSNTISVLLGNGDGTLQPAVSYTVGNSPRSVAVGDFNGDGRTDLVVANYNDNTVTILVGALSAALNITSTHTASFYPGQTGATYAITVSNNGPGATLGTLTVTDLLPTGLTATAITGTGWTCVLSTLTCTRSDALAPSATYAPVTLTVNAAANAPHSVTNMVSVSGGNTVGSSASDPTVILNLPSAFALSSPANGATGVSVTPILTWTAATGAASYNVYFGVTAVPPFAANTTSLQYSPSQLAPGTTYNWQVAAVNAAGANNSPVFSFTTLGTPQTSKVGIFRDGFFWILDVDGNRLFDNPPDLAFPFGGIPGDVPISGDWTGNGQTKVGIYRSANGLFLLDSNGDGVFDAGDAVYNLGVGLDPTDIPVVGDWNGDGRSKVGIFRQGFLWLLDYNGDGAYTGPPTDRAYFYGGIPGDLPVVGDWSGTGTSKIGIFRLGFYWVLDANGNGSFDGTAPGQDYAFPFGGIANDLPVVGDWNGTGISKVGIFRLGFFWVLDSNNPADSTHSVGSAFAFGGISGDKPAVGKW
jgi:uncharacterized repeat protein (TIGR01451 family)